MHNRAEWDNQALYKYDSKTTLMIKFYVKML